ncbi:leucine efflux protein LeuE [Streptomyces alfalfae]|uniref:Leucine efflux protein LeuE n=1 Tax=Streptomyces alfalfae TaxID=1642299 RepID=A0A7T4TZ61_9ACTN|nr:leucine efflux protein LeuE [Streptomyces alfalfae]QQC91009.1 leucine efflux protein LeuE [Streptomyces alfalfae]
MLGVTDLPTYLAGLVLIILLPGPNSLYVLSVAARRGVRTGYTAAAGVWCGDTVLMTLSAAGVASLLQANALLFGIVKYAGAGYLTWLAFGMLRAAVAMWRTRHERAAGADADAAGGEPAERPFRRALVISLFAQAASFLYLTALIFSGTRLAAAFRRRKRLSAGATSAAGALFLGFAVKLSLSSV